MHQSEDGSSVSKDCQICHSILAQGSSGNMVFSSAGESLEFKHPTDIDQAWKESMCVDCHSGLSP
jgi:hypothetical protein